MTGKMLGGEKEVEVVAENKRPDFMRVDVTVQKAVQTSAFDGKGGWRMDPFAGIGGGQSIHLLTPLESAEAKLQADMDGPLVDYAAKGHKLEYLGAESVEGSQAHKLKVTLKNGNSSVVYLDADSFLEVKSLSKRTIRGQEMESEQVMGDYKEVGGLLFPHSLEMGMKGMPQRQKLQVEKIELDVAIDDGRFKAPPAPKVEEAKPGAPKPEAPKVEAPKPEAPKADGKKG
jgi:hypothetical protein